MINTAFAVYAGSRVAKELRMERLRPRELVPPGVPQSVLRGPQLDSFIEHILHALRGLIGSEITSYDEMDPVRGASIDR